MARTGTAEIRLNRRTIRIGHEVYPLANISRVQTVQIRYKKNVFQPIRGLIIALFAAVVLGAVVTAAEVEQADQIVGAIVALAALRVVYLLGVLIYRLLRRPIYSLAIETAGTQFTLLSSHDQGTIHMIENEVVNAIENPPESERVLHVGDVFVGDKVSGNKNIQSGGVGNTINAHR
jgi:hypothetical protein